MLGGMGVALSIGLFGGWSTLLKVVLIVMVLDFVSGALVAIKNGDLSIIKARDGIINKSLILIFIIVAHQADLIANTTIIMSGVLSFVFWTESVSILENMNRGKVKYPQWLLERLRAYGKEVT